MNKVIAMIDKNTRASPRCTAPAGSQAPGQTDRRPRLPLFVEMGLVLAHLALHLFTVFALFPEASIVWLGEDYSTPATAGLIACAGLVGYSKLILGHISPRVLQHASAPVILGFILAVPVVLIYLALSVLALTLGGLAGIGLVWKGVPLFAFFLWYLD